MDSRIIELALEALKARKAAVETEIAEVEAELRGIHRRIPEKMLRVRNLQSERMKAYWARKRAESQKLSGAATRARAIRKSGPQSAAARKAVSERMKVYWAKRRAEEAKAAKKAKS